MEAPEMGEGAAPGLKERHSMIAVLASAGIAAPVIFTVVAIVHSLLREDHSLVALPIRALAVGPSGWMQDVNFVICGVLFLACPIGLHLEVRKMRWGVVGPALLVVSGAGLVLAGIFPAVAASSNLTYDSLGHTVASLIAFLGTGGGFIVISRRLAGDPNWRNLSTCGLGSGIAIVVLLFAFGALAEGPGAPLHPWIGLVQWVMVAVWITCTVVRSPRLLRAKRAADAPG